MLPLVHFRLALVIYRNKCHDVHKQVFILMELQVGTLAVFDEEDGQIIPTSKETKALLNTVVTYGNFE